jgi:endoglucanase
MAQTPSVPNNRPAPDYWHTQGSMMLNSSNQRVRIQGINWYGFETATQVVHGLDKQDYRTILDRVQEMGFNTLRLPFSNQMVESPIVPSTVSFEQDGHAINSDLRGLKSIQVLDRVIAYAGSLGLRVILDNHRSEAGDGAAANGLWYTAAYPESSWIADWQALAMRYAGNSTVIGMDIRNEPHLANKGGACWDCGSKAKDWHLAAERAGNAILAINPELLIFVEGTDVYNNDYYWWGGNLEGVRTSPVVLNVPHQLVYSAHDYGATEYAQPWFNSNTTYASLETVWTKHWAFIAREDIAPVWLGEFGTNADALDARDSMAGSQGQWFSSMVRFLGANSDIHWTYWALNGEDRYGLLNTGYESGSSSTLKQTLLSGIQMGSRPQVAQTSAAHYQTAGE